jgi:DNA-binding CsgD family transcriptional regulator
MNLTETNKQIIEHLAAGKLYKEIADIMTMSRHTIIDRVKAMKKKYEAKTIAELVIKVKIPNK